MERGTRRQQRFTRNHVLHILCSLMCALSASGQQSSQSPVVPANFKLDMETAAHLRPSLARGSQPAWGRFAIGVLVFEHLLKHVVPASPIKLGWQLRIVDDDQFNAYASPDGTVYVESGLARLAGPSAGLWAAVLSHEVAHIVRRDWARRYLYQESLQRDGGATIVLGDPGFPSASWTSSEKSSGDLARFCRQIEVEADREGLMLMARAGYHPDFVPALHHLLHAQESGNKVTSLYAMHPCWEERDRELSQSYLSASIEFERRWPAWYASPGGNPPVVVFADEPTVRKNGGHGWEINIPMRCQNLAGAVEVVLRMGPAHDPLRPVESVAQPASSSAELRQLTGCTSPRTTVTFNLGEAVRTRNPSPLWADVYVLDAWGAVLARMDLPKLPR